MFQWIIGALLFEYTGLFIRWLAMYLFDSLKGKEPQSFNSLRNKYRGISADSVAYDFGNKLIGTAFILIICYLLINH
jgi:hypothetical protein